MTHFTPTQLLDPVTWTSFLQDKWEKDFLYLPARGEDYYDALFQKKDVDALIPLAVGERGVRLANDGQKSVVPNDAAALYQAYQQGTTVVINRVHRLWRSVNLFCLALGELLHHPPGVNLYLTPPGSVGFGAHYDTHDVFVLQIAGRKVWDLYGVHFELPLEGQKIPIAEDLGPPQHSLELGAGALLYMPRGLVHQARTPEDSSSLHLTLGIHNFRWGDLMEEVLYLARHQELEFRRALPPGFLHKPPEELADHLQKLLSQFSENADQSGAVSRLADRMFSRAPAPIDNHFSVLDRVSELTPATLLKKRVGTLYYFYEEGDQMVLVFSEGSVLLPARIRKAVEFILKSEWFSLASIPQLDASGQMILARKLIKEGLLTTVD
jgi:ribosomal protein L16 Arg81 hydroxylase